MGNSLGGKKTTKIMKINGETMKLKTPIQAKDIVKDYPGHVVLDSEAVKHYGIRAKPLDPLHNLEPRRVYFLVELPKFPNVQGHQHRVPRRARSGISMSAKDRLESLMLARRSVSDLSVMGPATPITVDRSHDGTEGVSSGMRLRMRLPKGEVERLMSQSRDQNDVAEKIVDLCVGQTTDDVGRKGKVTDYYASRSSNNLDKSWLQRDRGHGSSGSPASYKKRVGFLPIQEAEIGIAVAS